MDGFWEFFGEEYDPDREWNKTPKEEAEEEDTEELMAAMEDVETDSDRAWNELFMDIEKPKLNTRKENSSNKSYGECMGPIVRAPERPNRLIIPPQQVPQNQNMPVAVPTWSPSHGNHMLHGVQHPQYAAPPIPNMMPSPQQQPWYPYPPHPHWSPTVPHWTGRNMVPSMYYGQRPILQHHHPYAPPQRTPTMMPFPPPASQVPKTSQDASSQTMLFDAETVKKASEKLRQLVPEGTCKNAEVKIMKRATKEKGKLLHEHRSKYEQLCDEARKFNADNQKLRKKIAERQEDLKSYLTHQGPVLPSISNSIMEQERIKKFNVAKEVYKNWREKYHEALDIETKYGADISLFLFNERRGIGIPQKVRKSTGGYNLHKCLNPKEDMNWMKKSPEFRNEWEAAHEKLKEWQAQLEELGLVELHDAEAYRTINVRKRNFTKPRH